MWQCPKCGYNPMLDKIKKSHDSIKESIEDFKRVLESYNVESESTETIQEGTCTTVVPNKKTKRRK